MGIGMGMNPFQMPMKPKPDLIKMKENLQKLYGKGKYLSVDILYNYIKEKINQLKKPNSNFQVDIIKINFYDTILEIKSYD